MADFFTRLAQRSLGQFPLSQPVIAPRFGRATREPENPGFEMLLDREERRKEQAAQPENGLGQESTQIPPANSPGIAETFPLQNSQSRGIEVSTHKPNASDVPDSTPQISGTVESLKNNDALKGSQTSNTSEIPDPESSSIRELRGPTPSSPSTTNFHNLSRSPLPENESVPDSVISVEGLGQPNASGQGSPESPLAPNAGAIGNAELVGPRSFEGFTTSNLVPKQNREHSPDLNLEAAEDSIPSDKREAESSRSNHAAESAAIPFSDFQGGTGSLPSLAVRDAELPAEPEIQHQPRTVKVTIGRVEVRAIQPKPPPQPKPAPPRPRPAVSLNDYLKQRSRGGV